MIKKTTYLIMFLLSLLTVNIFAVNKVFYGKASWYGGKFHGRTTASGEIYNMNKLTAAHKKLPFGTILKVTNLSNGKVIQVKVNDRGPFVIGRIIDLSKRAAQELDYLKQGVTKIKAEVVFRPDKNQRDFDFQDEIINPSVSKSNSSMKSGDDKSKDIDAIIKSLKNNLEGKSEDVPKKVRKVSIKADKKKPVVSKNKISTDSRKFEQKIFKIFVIQLGAFTEKSKANKFQQNLRAKGIEAYVTQIERDNLLLFKVREKNIYRDIESVKKQVLKLRKMGIKCFVVGKFFFAS